MRSKSTRGQIKWCLVDHCKGFSSEVGAMGGLGRRANNLTYLNRIILVAVLGLDSKKSRMKTGKEMIVFIQRTDDSGLDQNEVSKS